MELCTSAQKEHSTAVSEQVSLNDSDDEVNTLFGVTEEENDAEPSISVTQGVTNRREKIAEFLKDSKEKKMTSRCSIEKQQLTLMKEEIVRLQTVLTSNFCKTTTK